MATFSIPDNKGKFSQPNKGNRSGNIFMSYNLDLEDDSIKVSEQTKKLLTSTDNANFSGYAGSIVQYEDNSLTGGLFAISDKAFEVDSADPTGTWSESTAGSEPDSGNISMDSVFFDSLVLVSEATDIKSWNGSTWSSWWTGTLGASALTAGSRHLMKVGADGNLYIVDLGNKLYKVNTTGTETVSGNGTLDFSATNQKFTALATTSNRLWIGTEDQSGVEGTVLEWDMSATSNTVNRVHNIGAKAVRCIAVWNDTPIAILSSGEVKYFNGSSFVDFDKSIRFPSDFDGQLDEDFVHPNGWAIIDGLPHFLVMGRVVNDNTETGIAQSKYNMPSGVWCLNPSIGLYHRFAVGTGESTQADYGKVGLREVGALFSLKNSDSKFLCSYEYTLDNGATSQSVLAYHDSANSQDGRGILITPFVYGLREALKIVEMYHKKMATGEKIKLFYRKEEDESLGLEGTWANTTTFNHLGVGLGITTGDVALVKTGAGSGQLLRIASATESSTVTSVVFEEANTFATAGDVGAIDVLNFRFMGTVDDTTRDYHTFNVPQGDLTRKTQFLLEFQQKANNKMDLDFAVISS